MKNFVGNLIGQPAAATPLDRAQEIMYRAFDTPDPNERVELAKQALEVSPDCADAYVLLAENASNRKETLEYYEQGVAAGVRALGPQVFQENLGHFWGVLETRPYMRAREGLANTLWTMGRREEAASHLQDMLRLNPGDNQGVRYTLASWLLNLDRDQELAQLLAQYDDDASATWAFSRALLAFRQQGDTPESRELLKSARKRNKAVTKYLLGEEPLSREMPECYSPGDRNEAIWYVGGALGAWRSTPGAITWVREVLKKPKKRSAAAERPVGPSALAIARLRRLPKVYDVWQAGFRRIPTWVESEGERVIPWVVLVASRSNDLVLATTMLTEEPSADHLWDVLAGAMQQPPVDEPHRPAQIEVLADARWDELRPHLDQIEMDLETTEELDFLDALFEDLSQHLTRDEPPGLLEVPRVTPEIVASFYQAAAEFYRRAPWRSLGYEAAIKVECDRFQSGPWYAVVMGQSGVALGVALYEDLNLLRKLWTKNLSDSENARQTVALAVTFDPEMDVPPKDLEAARRHGWVVANPEAYPTVYRKERGMSMRPPLSWELVLLEGCLRAIPQFLSQHPPGEAASQKLTVPVSTGKLDLVLSWAAEA